MALEEVVEEKYCLSDFSLDRSSGIVYIGKYGPAEFKVNLEVRTWRPGVMHTVMRNDATKVNLYINVDGQITYFRNASFCEQKEKLLRDNVKSYQSVVLDEMPEYKREIIEALRETELDIPKRIEKITEVLEPWAAKLYKLSCYHKLKKPKPRTDL